MEFLLDFLPIVIYILIIAILVIGIIFGIKALKTIDKVDRLVDDVNEKMDSLEGLFNVVDFLSEKVSTISDRFIDFVSGFISKLWYKKSKKNIEEEEDYE